MFRPTLFFAAAALSISGTVYAHPKLVATTPAAGASVGAPVRITLRFSEKLITNFSGADVTMTGASGMSHGAMRVDSIAAVAPDGRTLVITPKSKLGVGNYTVAWHVVSTDTHRVNGTLAFAVK